MARGRILILYGRWWILTGDYNTHSFVAHLPDGFHNFPGQVLIIHVLVSLVKDDEFVEPLAFEIRDAGEDVEHDDEKAKRLRPS